MPRIKKSYGIICIRPSKQGVQMVMVKKATTYHFSEFVSGHYTRHNETHIMKLFNNMTYHEKMDILTLKFQNMWYRVYMSNMDDVLHTNRGCSWINFYLSKKNKFERIFVSDGGKKIRRLIHNAKNASTPWEFPKGRKDNDKEQDLDTAIREFEEETGISYSNYKILWHINPYIETYTDFGTTYRNTYYYAEAIGDWNPVYKFYDKKQVSEVADVRWVSKNDLKYMNLEKLTYNRMKKCFNKIIKKYKNAHSKYMSSFIYSTKYNNKRNMDYIKSYMLNVSYDNNAINKSIEEIKEIKNSNENNDKQKEKTINKSEEATIEINNEEIKEMDGDEDVTHIVNKLISDNLKKRNINTRFIPITDNKKINILNLFNRGNSK